MRRSSPPRELIEEHVDKVLNVARLDAVHFEGCQEMHTYIALLVVPLTGWDSSISATVTGARSSSSTLAVATDTRYEMRRNIRRFAGLSAQLHNYFVLRSM